MLDPTILQTMTYFTEFNDESCMTKEVLNA